jgi:rare lipoprotein A
LLLPLAGCGGGAYHKTGLASWYGVGMAGRTTASGVPFDPAAMTAAHRTLPLGTIAEVTAPATGRTVRVMITDRGPRDRHRLIDLSHDAADTLGIARLGVAKVRVRAVGRQRLPSREAPVGTTAGPWIVQVASLADRASAQRLAAALGGRVEPAGRWFRVRLGPFNSRAEAQRARDGAVRAGYGDALIIVPS